MAIVISDTKFDLARMKRLLGTPTLLGDEKIEHFDEFALAVATALDPGDMAAHVLVYQYVMETWILMRLRRLQGHINRLHGINVENQADLAKVTETSEAEAEAFAAQQVAHQTHVKLDYLLTQSTKRIHNIHLQIAMYRVALAEKIKLNLDIEERRRRLLEMTPLRRPGRKYKPSAPKKTQAAQWVKTLASIEFKLAEMILVSQQDSSQNERFDSGKRPPFSMDLAKMKRWHGRPPLLHYQSENDFDEFILALASCVLHGDVLVECLVYRYGLEKWKIFQFESQRQTIMLIEHRLRREFDKRDVKRETHRNDKKNNSAERSEIIYEHLTKFITDQIVSDNDISDIKQNMHYKHKLDELALTARLHDSLDFHADIGAAIDKCNERLVAIEQELATHEIFLSEKADQQYWDLILETAHPNLNSAI
jgi:hypothetical protein